MMRLERNMVNVSSFFSCKMVNLMPVGDSSSPALNSIDLVVGRKRNLTVLWWTHKGLLAITKSLTLIACINQIVFDELFKETGHGSRIVVSLHCNWLHDKRIISQ